MESASHQIRRRTTLQLKFVLAAAIVIAFAGAMFLKRGAIAGSYDANYRARASMLARDPALRDSEVFPELAVGGGDFAEVDDAHNTPLWKSPGLAATGKRLDRADRDLLTNCPLPDGTQGWSVKVNIRLPDGRPGSATYAGHKAAFLHDLAWVVGWLGGVFVLPVVVIVLLYPQRKS